MLLFKKIIVGSFLTIGIICFASGIYLDNHYAYNMSRVPQKSLGREYPLNIHGTIVFLTREESRNLDLLSIISMLSLAGAIVFNYILLKKEK